MNTSDDAEHIYNGYLTVGYQKKGSTHISFKDKYRRYFVLRCLKHHLLTLSGYKHANDFTSPRGHLIKNVEQIVLTKDSEVHTMYFPAVKKHKESSVLCILKDKQVAYYLEADRREDLDDWCSAINGVFVRLGWKEIHVPPQVSSHGSNQQQPSQRPNGTMERSAVKSADLTEVSQKHILSRDRSFSDHQGRTPSAKEGSSSHYEEPSIKKRPSAETVSHNCCTRAHVTLEGSTNPDLYVNIHNVQDQSKWMEENAMRHENLVSVREIYANLPHPHPAPPPELPPRGMHARHGTFPGASYTPPSSPRQSPKHSSVGFFEAKNHQSHDAKNVPTINLPDVHVPSQSFTRQYPHLFDDSEAARRKISLPQPLNLMHRSRGGLQGITASPPASPVMMRKGGSHSNLVCLDLSNRPLPSPLTGDTFDFNTLRWEISHTSFRVDLCRDDLEDMLALVRIGDFVWIAGWKSGCSALNKKLHVGDQLRQINEQIVVDPVIANTLFTTSANEQIALVIRRLPHAKVRHLHRLTTEENWGVEVEGNRVVQVSTCGPASDAKMTPRAPGALSERLCDWIITEIDGEPVSLLGKKDEVKNRMASAGLEMTLTIQPDDFVKRLKAELQKVKFFHEYFVGSDCTS
ncbi:uncharacterized protein LOC117294549 [Asterias rubens]|uniref:uncharacterized protein LOC117294549 n=1 Tax=Asterias rubens TaxID=7604 RepID=UPI0014551229|nr:uncharacterized protein LOC117294549 [Asterias rubens]